MQFAIEISSTYKMMFLYVLRRNRWRYLDTYNGGFDVVYAENTWRNPNDNRLGSSMSKDSLTPTFSCNRIKKARGIAVVYFKMQM